MKLLAILLSSLLFGAKLQAKDTLQIGMLAEFESLNPIVLSQAASRYVMYMAHRPLFALTPDGKWYSPILKEVPSLENKLVKKKGKNLELNIEFKEAVKWGDGTPVTCKDLAFTWNVGKSPNVSVPAREEFDGIIAIDVDAANPKKCKVTLEKIRFDYLNAFPDILPQHLEEKVFNQHKDQPEGYDKNSLYVSNSTNPGLYFGPYLISEVKLGSHIIMTPNPHFYGKKPHFKKIIFKILPNNNTHTSNLKSGNIDMISSPGGLGIDQAVAFEKEVKKDNLPYQVVFENGTVYAHMDLNLENPILADLRVRKALSHAFNKKEMVDTLLEGRGTVAISNLTPSSPWFNAKTNIYAFDRKTAGKLLDEAGWKMGADRYRFKDGKKLTLTLICAGGVKLNDMIQTYIQAQYKAVGVELILKSEPARVFFGETMKRKKFDLALYSWVSMPEQTPRSTLHSESIPTEKNSWAGQNTPSWNSPTVDKLIDDLEMELEPAKRYAIGRKIVDEYTKDIPVIPVYFRPNNSVIPKAMKGFRLSGHLYYETLAVEEWVWE